MQEAISLWPLIGIAVIVVGFVLRFNPVLVVIISGIVTGVAAHMPIATILEKLGEGFLNTRNLPFILLLPLAVIGLLERHGLKERAQAWIAKIHSATAGRLLIVYLFVREATAALGLTSLGGHPQMVRPLLAPMAEGAAEKRFGPLPGNVRYRLRAMSAATDNVGLFFGEDIFSRLRRDHLHAQLYAGVGWDPDGTVAYCPVGDPDGDLRLSDPRRAPVATRSPSPARAGPDKRRAGERRCGMNFQQTYLYWLAGAVLLVVAIMSWRDKSNPRRLTTGLFWGLYGLVFLLGDWTYQLVGDKRTVNIAVGGVVVVLALIAGFGGVRLGSYHQRTQEEKTASAKRLGNKLFFPALAIPVVTVIGVLLFNNLPSWQVALFGPGNHATLITLFSMTVGTLIGLAMAIRMTHETVAQPMQEARRLLDSVGWAFILPQILAVLGLLFTAAGVGTSISWLTEHYLAVDNRFIAVAVYAIGMAVLTMVMGNAFAAFPIVTAGVGIPILVLQHGGNPAVMAAIGMFSGYCGTLMTPMAANFNIVPAALLELPDKNAVIKAQIPTGILLLIVNVFLLYFLMFL